VIRDISGGPVLGAAVSVDGTGLAWVGQDRILHLRGALDGSWSYDAAESGAFTGDLLATDGTNWVEGNDGSVALVTPQAAAAPVVLDVGAAVVAAQVAGDTVALRTDFETRFFDIATGRKRQVTASGRTGGLSPDGTLYVDDSLNVFNVHEGTSTGVGIGQDEVAVWWTSNASFAMVSQNGDHRVLWSCTIQPHRCIELYDDSTGTLELPGQE
jgi:hypothetical protein